MADLEQVIGALLSGLAHARRMADEQTTAIAQYYQANPLLSGMTVPRVRVPEMTVELPLLIEALTEGEAPELAPEAAVSEAARAAVARTLDGSGAALPDALRDQFLERLGQNVGGVQRDARERMLPAAVARESLAALAERALLDTLDAAPTGARPQLSQAQRDRLTAAVKADVRAAALLRPGGAAALRASVLTSDIKEKANSQTVTRLRLVLREEGLEWQETRRKDGSTTATLSPE